MNKKMAISIFALALYFASLGGIGMLIDGPPDHVYGKKDGIVWGERIKQFVNENVGKHCDISGRKFTSKSARIEESSNYYTYLANIEIDGVRGNAHIEIDEYHSGKIYLMKLNCPDKSKVGYVSINNREKSRSRAIASE